jgi:hypothetical protein
MKKNFPREEIHLSILLATSLSIFHMAPSEIKFRAVEGVMHGVQSAKARLVAAGSASDHQWLSYE